MFYKTQSVVISERDILVKENLTVFSSVQVYLPKSFETVLRICTQAIAKIDISDKNDYTLYEDTIGSEGTENVSLFLRLF